MKPRPDPSASYQIGAHPPIPAVPADGDRPVCGVEVQHQDGLGAAYVPTLLTEVVLRLRKHWLDGCAQDWGIVRSVRHLPLPDFDQRVAAALGQGFTHFSQFLAGLEVLLLQRQKFSAEAEQTLLGVEQHVVELRKLCADQLRIAQLQGAAGQFDGLAQPSGQPADQ